MDLSSGSANRETDSVGQALRLRLSLAFCFLLMFGGGCTENVEQGEGVSPPGLDEPALPAQAQSSPVVEPDPRVLRPIVSPSSRRLLFVGNSYTFAHDLPGVLELLADRWDLSPPLETRTVAFPGVSLQEQWDRGNAAQAIAEGGWDGVVLQGHSLKPLTEPQQVAENLRRFHAAIRGQGAKTFLYLTWARKGVPAMQEGLDALMGAMGKELGAQVIPVGPAWQRAALEEPQIELYDEDGSHPAPAGTYLAACVFIASLYGPEAVAELKKSTETSDPGWQVLAPGSAAALREVARRTVKEANVFPP